MIEINYTLKVNSHLYLKKISALNDFLSLLMVAHVCGQNTKLKHSDSTSYGNIVTESTASRQHDQCSQWCSLVSIL